MEMKKCPICEKTKELEAFRRLTGLGNKFNKNCQECIAVVKERYEKNKDEIKAYQKTYREEHREYFQTYRREWAKKNPDILKKWENEQYDKDARFKWVKTTRQHLRGLIEKALEFEATLGCSSSEFRQHMESRFEPGMSWENYGRGSGKWSIDHIKPLSKCSPEENPNHYTNLQPMWNCENSRKGNRS